MNNSDYIVLYLSTKNNVVNIINCISTMILFYKIILILNVYYIITNTSKYSNIFLILY